MMNYNFTPEEKKEINKIRNQTVLLGENVSSISIKINDMEDNVLCKAVTFNAYKLNQEEIISVSGHLYKDKNKSLKEMIDIENIDNINHFNSNEIEEIKKFATVRIFDGFLTKTAKEKKPKEHLFCYSNLNSNTRAFRMISYRSLEKYESVFSKNNKNVISKNIQNVEQITIQKERDVQPLGKEKTSFFNISELIKKITLNNYKVMSR